MNTLTSEESKRIAGEILRQLGGNKFLVMTGSKPKYCDGYSSMYQLTRNRLNAKYMKITLNAMDTYDIEFITLKRTLNKKYSLAGLKIYDEEPKTIKTLQGIYNDQLQEVFTDQTGLYTHL